MTGYYYSNFLGKCRRSQLGSVIISGIQITGEA